ncbi:hypothetical protein PVK06_014810 [Gossypium arboreum]|uniref:Uncharacterized protein n=1 Tax=Gossypium arboreum TaxID=29729 RepID=A0ABR0PVH0_GOSAR|nr:hypothetical protein PVK06_014810 [Gossypium arboreum]
MKQWEALENALKSMQEKALDFQFQQQERRKSREKEEEKGIASFSGSENIDKDKKDNDFGSLVDELLLLGKLEGLEIKKFWLGISSQERNLQPRMGEKL